MKLLLLTTICTANAANNTTVPMRKRSLSLNDVFYGGETDFPKVNMKIQPRKGSAVLFRNLIGNTRESDPLSLHAGLPPTQNEEKWIINVWTRDTLYDLYSS